MKDPAKARKGFVRLGTMWGVLLVFVAVALLTRSLVVLAVGVVASVVTSLVMRAVGR